MHSISDIKSKWIFLRRYIWFTVPFCRILLFGAAAYGAAPDDSSEGLSGALQSNIKPSGIDGSDQYQLSACPGTPVCFDIFLDKSHGEKIIAWDQSIPGAAFEIAEDPSTGVVTAHFCWTTPMNSGKEQSYSFHVLTGDGKEPALAGNSTEYTIHVSGISINESVTKEESKTTGRRRVQINVSGGQSPYSYQWDRSPESTLKESNLLPGLHLLTVTDDNGCTAQKQIDNSSAVELCINRSETLPGK